MTLEPVVELGLLINILLFTPFEILYPSSMHAELVSGKPNFARRNRIITVKFLLTFVSFLFQTHPKVESVKQIDFLHIF